LVGYEKIFLLGGGGVEPPPPPIFFSSSSLLHFPSCLLEKVIFVEVKQRVRMSITSIKFYFNDDPVDTVLTFTATPDGISVSRFDQIVRAGAINILIMWATLHQADCITVQIASFEEDIFLKRYEFDTIRKMHREHNSKDEENGDLTLRSTCESEHAWFFITLFEGVFKNMYRTCTLLKKREAIEGKDCPVLLTPLTDSCVLLKKCSHYISREAWDKLAVEGSTKKCPLCRAEHTPGEIE